MKEDGSFLTSIVPKFVMVITVFQAIFVSIFYWIIFSLGVVILFLVHIWNKKEQLQKILENEGIRTYYKNHYGIFVSRFDLKPQANLNHFNQLGIFIIPKKNETAEQVLLRYLPLLNGLECDVFAFNRPKISKKLTKRKAIENYCKIFNAYLLFLVKTAYLNKIILIADIKMAPLALSIASQVPTLGVILDATKRRRKYKRWSKFFTKIQSFSFVNFWVNITAKKETELENFSQKDNYIPPVMLIGLKEPKIKKIFRLQCFNLRILKERVLKSALKIRTIEHDEEFKSSIQLFIENLSEQNPFLLHN